jgi:hypothetical protein
MVENRMLGTIYGLKREEVTAGYRKVHEELHNLYSSSYIIKMIKEDDMGRTCSMHRRDENAYKLSENLKGRDYLEDLETDWGK